MSETNALVSVFADGGCTPEVRSSSLLGGVLNGETLSSRVDTMGCKLLWLETVLDFIGIFGLSARLIRGGMAFEAATICESLAIGDVALGLFKSLSLFFIRALPSLNLGTCISLRLERVGAGENPRDCDSSDVASEVDVARS